MFYSDLLKWPLKHTLIKLRAEKFQRLSLLQHDNAKPQTVHMRENIWEDLKWEILSHLP